MGIEAPTGTNVPQRPAPAPLRGPAFNVMALMAFANFGVRSMRKEFGAALVLLCAILGVPLAAGLVRGQAAVDPAAQAVESCSSARVSAERECYQTALLERLREGGAGAALGLLDRLAELDDSVRRDGHMYAHGIGLAALPNPDQVGRVFASCTPAWQSGCYHGVIQSYFLATRRAGTALTTPSVDALCADYRGGEGQFWLLFQCTHGLGHGLTMFHGHDLRLALGSCDLLSRQSERESCYGGAFMENIVNVTHPHHVGQAVEGGADHAGHGGHPAPAPSADAHAAHDAHSGHGAAHPRRAAVEPWRPLDPSDLHYPCSVVDAKYQGACYTIQTAAMLYHTRQDIGRTARECGRAPERVRRTCYESLGRDLSTIAGRDVRDAVRLCDLAEARFRADCNVGVVQSVINMNTDPAQGVPYCRAITDAASKRACYAVVGRQASGLANGAERRQQACARAEPAFVDVCLGREAREIGGTTVTARRMGRSR